MGVGIAGYIIICAVAVAVSALTLFSGFGLGTLLMPAFALFFTVPVAIAATAVVHLANNLFKFLLLRRHVDWRAAVRFMVPAAPMAVAGALLLKALAETPPLAGYQLGGRPHEVTAVKIVVGLLIAVFAVLELVTGWQEKFQLPRRFLPLGGAASGFLGGLSGLQGALRSAVLIRSGLQKEAYIATGVACSVAVDVARLVMYWLGFNERFRAAAQAGGGTLLAAAVLAAFAGAFIGARLMKKVTMRAVHYAVGVLLLVAAVGLVSGLV